MMKYFLLVVVLICLPLSISAQSYEDLIEKSFEYLDNDELAAAEESIRAAMRLEPANPHNYALLTNLGTIQWKQGNLQDAVLSYTAALSRNQENTSILESRASLYILLGETEKAINDYSVVIAKDPLNQDALYNRGILYLQQQNFLLAEADFDRIMEINDKTINGRLGHAVLEKMRGNYSESERIYNYLIQESPRYWFLYESRADLYFQMGKNGRAMSDLNKVFAETEPTAALYVLRGKVKLAQYEKAAAIKDFEVAREMGYDKDVLDELMRMAK
ncbi:MAG: tetratricopeptide repeat protein [Tannerellaceae bacterium]|nr:tetratricopeptide repeat protein [Tannerellaceae bacterium]